MNRKGSKFIALLAKQKACIAIIALFTLMLFPHTNFYTAYNMLDMLNSASTLMVVAFGVTLVIIAGGIDLSVGGILSLGGILVIKMLHIGVPLWLAIMLSLIAGAVVGAINGYLVVYKKTEPFIITLGMGGFLTGLCMQLTNAKPIAPPTTQLMIFGNSKTLGVPNLVIITCMAFIVLYIVLRYTQFGRNCYAIGGDFEVAEYSGIPAYKIKAMTYVISGIVATLAGIMVTAKLNSGSHLFGEQTALNVISAAVVGGVSLAGGVGGMPQAAIGYLFIAILNNVMNMMSIAPYYQRLVLGLVIVFIISLDSYGRKIKRQRV